MTPWKQTTHSHGYLNYNVERSCSWESVRMSGYFRLIFDWKLGKLMSEMAEAHSNAAWKPTELLMYGSTTEEACSQGDVAISSITWNLLSFLFTHINVNLLISSSLSLLMWFLSLGNCLSLCDWWKFHSSISDLAGHSIECLRTMCQRHSPRIAVWSPKRNLHFKDFSRTFEVCKGTRQQLCWGW